MGAVHIAPAINVALEFEDLAKQLAPGVGKESNVDICGNRNQLIVPGQKPIRISGGNPDNIVIQIEPAVNGFWEPAGRESAADRFPYGRRPVLFAAPSAAAAG